MRTSISTTSGCSSAARRTASAPFAGLAGHRQVVLAFQQHPEAQALQGVVVGDEHGGHQATARGLGAGRCASTRQPPQGAGPARSVPS